MMARISIGMMIKTQIPAFLVAISIFMAWWAGLTELEKYNAPTAAKAASIGMDESDFIFLSSVVEAESNRGTDADSYQGRVLIAEVVFNRAYESDEFSDTIAGVLTEPGQFDVVYGYGSVAAYRTNLSDAAVLEAYEEWQDGDAPMVMYFNNSGYNYGTPYGYYGGNYFVTVP